MPDLRTEPGHLDSRARAMMQRLLSALPVAALLVDDRGDVLFANAGAANFFGGAADVLVGQSVHTLAPGLEAVLSDSAIDANAGSGTVVRVQARGPNDASIDTLVHVATIEQTPPNLVALYLQSSGERLSNSTEAAISEQRLAFALEAAAIGDWDMDLRTNVAFRSRLHDACFGYPEPLDEWGYHTFLSHVHPGDRERVDACFQAAMGGCGAYDVEFRAVWPDGSEHWLWSKGRFYFDASEKPIRVAGIQVDIHERKLREQELQLSALAMACTTEGITIADATDPESPLIYANAGFERMTGYSLVDVLGKNCRFLQGQDTDPAATHELGAAIRAGTSAHTRLKNYRKDGTPFWNEVRLSPVKDAAGRITHYLGLQTDVTQRVQAESEIVWSATHDHLTGLPNRALLHDRLQQALYAAERNGRLVAVAFIDIDRLKNVNDSVGHEMGDTLLQTVASRLRSAIRSIDTVSRFGGDEFIVLLTDIEHEHDVGLRITRLLDHVGMPLTLDGDDVHPSVSIGVAVYPMDASTPRELIKLADIAMYTAKSTNKGRYERYRAEFQLQLMRRVDTERRLRKALDLRQFVLHYQPRVSSPTRAMTGVEALVRWHDPEHGLIGPAQFIGIAEELGLIVELGAWVVGEVCRQHAAWRAAGAREMPIAINVSVAQLRQADFVGSVVAVLARHQVEAHWLEIEVTESMMMEDNERFLDRLVEFRRLGVHVSIDDFGTGYSSMSHLKRLPADKLKIDRSFIHDIDQDERGAPICKAIIDLSHSVGLTVVAEGVETEAQAQFLTGAGCDELQGFLFSAPVDADAILAFSLGPDQNQ